jgi:predicted GTPase
MYDYRLLSLKPYNRKTYRIRFTQLLQVLGTAQLNRLGARTPASLYVILLCKSRPPQKILYASRINALKFLYINYLKRQILFLG